MNETNQDEQPGEDEETAIPYAAEISRCEQLHKYLTASFMSEKREDGAEETAQLSGEFATMELTTKKSNDDHYMLPSPGSKKGKGGGGKKKAKKITLDIVTIEWFGDLGMPPPAVEDKVKNITNRRSLLLVLFITRYGALNVKIRCLTF